MQIYNTLTRKKETFTPRNNLPSQHSGEASKNVKMFVCGPTVYDNIHIGNARTFVFFDFVAKYLKYRGFEVEYIQNITDIDDRIIERAKKEGIEHKELALRFENIFREDVEKLGISGVKYVRATDHIPEIISQVKRLIDKGFAYKIEDDPDRNPSGSNGASGWYFDIKKFPQYGQLSGRTIEMADDAVSRIDENEKKRNRGDFCLWKFSKDGEPSWPADFGAGRPGWHIEDTAITEKFLGSRYDIHGGGQDLIFPHHEAEIAQQCSVSGLKPEEFVGYWMHTGFLVNKEKKMSKSLGNFMTLREALDKYSPEVLRYYFLSVGYRSPLDYSETNIKAAKAAIQRIVELKAKLEKIKNLNNTFKGRAEDLSVEHTISNIRSAIYHELDNDFNIQSAFGWLHIFIKDINTKDSGKLISQTAADNILAFFAEIDNFLNIIPKEITVISNYIQELVNLREIARKSNNLTEADKLRDKIEGLGYRIDDTPDGPVIKRRN